MYGNLINEYLVKGAGTGREAGREYHYKTLAGARRKYDAIEAGNATLYQLTDALINGEPEYIEIASK